MFMKAKFHNPKISSLTMQVTQVRARSMFRRFSLWILCLMSFTQASEKEANKFLAMNRGISTPVVENTMQSVTGSIRGQVRIEGVIAPNVMIHLFKYNIPGAADSITSTKTD